jgi:ketosteroid isomerase-like protein
MLIPDQTSDADPEIRKARAHSNRSIQRRNLLGVGDSLAEDFVAVIGDGTFVSSRKIYLQLFKAEFDSKDFLSYERTPEMVEVAASLASEQGHWTAARTDGTITHRGSYMAMWRHTPEGWKIRSELYVTLS